jgi:hypothetical protein
VDLRNAKRGSRSLSLAFPLRTKGITAVGCGVCLQTARPAVVTAMLTVPVYKWLLAVQQNVWPVRGRHAATDKKGRVSIDVIPTQKGGGPIVRPFSLFILQSRPEVSSLLAFKC